ncbi:hypothetical protein B1A99_17380 [Cohnella sp. CIP 111063]|uniref:M28 family peptidase n=1 Tax=unclassified Cohnella TaxID=2636738 RepID=UPI000B8BE475|nr:MULTISPECIES: M28 family peptidase [unclassified Cohnella]OXS57260.1 hypothetical protein B1A99_17380 [Cohnella sp. CIP 111063]PRX70699.1 peptidase M28-like protein [Cohnella sp. SGD-V74]
MTSQPPLAGRASAGAGAVAARLLKRTGIASALLVALFAGLLQVRAPQPAGPDAPADAFSAARAMEKVGVIAAEPRPAGSPAHDRVRDFLLAELTGLGLQPEVQTAEADSIWEPGRRVPIENIIARFPGTAGGSGKAVLLMAHYDSVPGTPGAGDNAAAIAAMLETARALRAGEPLKNDVLLLMTDGEEMGLHGAKAFAYEHPLARSVGLALNFDARGNRGPSFMFETSEDNGGLIREFVRGAPQPVAYSLLHYAYNLLSNETDLTPLMDSGLPGMNFVFAMGLNAYHKESDTPDNLDAASLQHHGSYMLGLARHFGGLDLENIRREDRVYFNVFGGTMVSYTHTWAVGLTLPCALLLLATLWHGFKRRRLTVGGLGGGLLLALLGIGLTYGIGALAWSIVRAEASPPQYAEIVEDPIVSAFYFVGVLALALAIAFVPVRLVSRLIRADDLWGGALLLWMLLCAGTALWLPGGSYLLLWPLLFSLIGLNVSFAVQRNAAGLLSALSAMPGIALFAPVAYLTFVMLTSEMTAELVAFSTLPCTLIYPLLKGVGRNGNGKGASRGKEGMEEQLT